MIMDLDIDSKLLPEWETGTILHTLSDAPCIIESKLVALYVRTKNFYFHLDRWIQ